MRSSSFCSFRNSGEALLMMIKARISTTMTTARRMNPISTSSRNARASAITKMTGTGRIIWIQLVTANWIVVISEMVRVVMDAVPN